MKFKFIAIQMRIFAVSIQANDGKMKEKFTVSIQASKDVVISVGDEGGCW